MRRLAAFNGYIVFLSVFNLGKSKRSVFNAESARSRQSLIRIVSRYRTERTSYFNDVFARRFFGKREIFSAVRLGAYELIVNEFISVRGSYGDVNRPFRAFPFDSAFAYACGERFSFVCRPQCEQSGIRIEFGGLFVILIGKFIRFIGTTYPPTFEFVSASYGIGKVEQFMTRSR